MATSPARVVTELLGTIPGRGISRRMGQIAALRPPRALLDRVVAAYVKAYGVTMAEVEVPSGGFRTFDEFFTRPIVPGARLIDARPGLVVCPCDGRLMDRGPIDLGGTLRIKGRLYRVSELVGPTFAAHYDGGEFVVIYLSPRDYHRVHAPAEGRVLALEHVPGTLLPVNATGVRWVPQLFARNERLAFHLETDEVGRMCLVMVGAVGVGRITVPFDDLVTNVRGASARLRRYEPARSIRRGEEIGTFHLGSTVVLFFAPGRTAAVGPRAGDEVRLGRPLAERVEST